MKMTIDKAGIIQIMKVCSPHVSKNHNREIYKYIHINLNGHTATATSSDGYKIAQTSVFATGDENHYIVPVVKLPKEFEFCTIECTDNAIILDFTVFQISTSKPQDITNIVEFNDCVPKSEASLLIGFNSKYMTDVFKSFDTNRLKFELHSPTEGTIISDNVSKVIILPIKL